MAQRRRVSNTPYIYDNTARDLQIRRQMEEPRRQMSHETRKNREKARHMSIGYVTFLMGALIACAAFLVNYIVKKCYCFSREEIICQREKILRKY